MPISRQVVPRILISIVPVTCPKNFNSNRLLAYGFKKCTKACTQYVALTDLGQLVPQLLELLEWTRNSPVLEVP